MQGLSANPSVKCRWMRIHAYQWRKSYRHSLGGLDMIRMRFSGWLYWHVFAHEMCVEIDSSLQQQPKRAEMKRIGNTKQKKEKKIQLKIKNNQNDERRDHAGKEADVWHSDVKLGLPIIGLSWEALGVAIPKLAWDSGRFDAFEMDVPVPPPLTLLCCCCDNKAFRGEKKRRKKKI